MEPAADLNELTERIRRAADRENGVRAFPSAAGGVAPGVPPAPGALPPLIVSALTADVLDQAKQLLPRLQRKNEVPATVPKLLRPLYRNQGGFNGVLLEMVERLITANRQLAEQIGQFRDWAEAVGQETVQTREWAAAMELRTDAFRDERLVEIEVRLNRLEQLRGGTENRSPGAPPDLLARIERLETQARQETRTAAA